jgi:hypothetical protein
MVEIALKERTKDKIVEAVIDVAKMAVYAAGAVLAVNILKEDVVKYINAYEKTRAERQVAVLQRNARVNASVTLVRFSKMLDYSRRVLDTRLSSGDHISTSDVQDFRDRLKDFSSSLKAYVSYSTDPDFGLLAFEITTMMRDLIDNIDAPDSPKKWKFVKRDIVLFGSQLSRLNLILRKEE